MARRFKTGPKPGNGGAVAKPIEHGTHSGFNLHRRRGELACLPCLMGERAYRNAYGRRGKCAKGLGWPLEASRDTPERGGRADDETAGQSRV